MNETNNSEDRLVDNCILCSNTTHIDDEEVFTHVSRGTPAWDKIPNPPTDVDTVPVCDSCFDTWIM